MLQLKDVHCAAWLLLVYLSLCLCVSEFIPDPSVFITHQSHRPTSHYLVILSLSLSSSLSLSHLCLTLSLPSSLHFLFLSLPQGSEP